MPSRTSRIVTLSLPTTARSQMLEITDRVREVVRRAAVREGMVVVYVPHTTAGVCINENADPDVTRDVLAKLEQLVPRREPYYRHAEGNSDSHVKSILTGHSATILIGNGELVLGRWQGIYLCEFDGPRTREAHVRCIDLGQSPLDG